MRAFMKPGGNAEFNRFKSKLKFVKTVRNCDIYKRESDGVYFLHAEAEGKHWFSNDSLIGNQMYQAERWAKKVFD